MLGWPLLMLLQNVFASVTALQARRLATKYESAHFHILSGVFVITYLVFLGYVLWQGGEISLSAAAAFAPHIALAGVAFTLWNVLTFVVFRFVDAAVGSLFTTLNLVAVVIISSLTIHETLSPTQLVGAVILFAAILVVLLSHLSKKKRHRWEIGLGLTVIASLAFGVAIATEKYLLDEIGMSTYSVFAVALQAGLIILLGLLYRPRLFALYKDSFFVKNVVLMGITRAGAGLLFVISLVLADNASLIGMLSGLKIIIIAILAGLFLRETQFMRRKLIASLLAVIGVGVMLW